MRVPGVPRWCGGHHPVGDATSGPVRLSFNPQLRVEFQGATVTSDAGLLLPRELDERLGLDALIERLLTDPCTGHNRQFPLADLFRQSIYSCLAGYEDTNDAERLAEDPTFRMLASRERRETSVALTSTLHWFETDVLAEERNGQGLARLNTALIQHASTRSSTRRVTLDIDSSESPVHGAQEQSAYNGHFESVCYHPLFVFNQDGDCLAATLRPGNVHSADGWDKVLLPAIDRYRNRGQIVDPASPSHASWVREAQDAARALGMRLQPVAVRDPSEIDSAFAEMVNEQAGAGILSTDTMFFLHSARLAHLAGQRGLPLGAPG